MRPTSDEEADLRLLGLANEKGKFALDMRGIADAVLQDALERGIDQEWFTLVDVTFIAAAPVPMRVFRLTAQGHDRLKVLQSRGLS